MSRTVLIRGPLTDDDVAEIFRTMQRIEQTRPDDTFEVMIDGPEAETKMNDLLAQVPPAPGYARIEVTIPR